MSHQWRMFSISLIIVAVTQNIRKEKKNIQRQLLSGWNSFQIICLNLI